MDTVWIVESGDYEQRGIERIFASEALAREYIEAEGLDEEPTEETVWPRVPQPVTSFRMSAVTADADAAFMKSVGYYLDGTWFIREEQWATRESGAPLSSRTAPWGKRTTPVFVEARGEDQSAVRAEFDRLRAAVRK
jgi:hypothetical protein